MRADTLAELANLIGVDADNLATTVAAYNAACVGDANNFRRDALRWTGGRRDVEPTQIELGPRHHGPAVSRLSVGRRPRLHVRRRCDRRARSLLRDGAPIPGLYAAGEITGHFTERRPTPSRCCARLCSDGSRDARLRQILARASPPKWTPHLMLLSTARPRSPPRAIPTRAARCSPRAPSRPLVEGVRAAHSLPSEPAIRAQQQAFWRHALQGLANECRDIVRQFDLQRAMVSARRSDFRSWIDRGRDVGDLRPLFSVASTVMTSASSWRDAAALACRTAAAQGVGRTGCPSRYDTRPRSSRAGPRPLR